VPRGRGAVDLGARGVARLSRGQTPVCCGRSAAGITSSRRHVLGRKTTGTRRDQRNKSPEPNVSILGAGMQFSARQTRGYGQKRSKRADTRGGGPVGRRRSGSFGCCAALRGRREVLKRPTKRGMDRRLGATTPRADTTGSHVLSSAWRQARAGPVMIRCLLMSR
jgi:hypothetical protein